MLLTIQKLADHLNAKIVGDDTLTINGPAKIESARSGDISFLAHQKYVKYLNKTEASAIIVDLEFDTTQRRDISYLKVDNVYASIKELLELFDQKTQHEQGVNESAQIVSNKHIDPTVSIGALTFIKENVSIGASTVLMGQIFIAENVSIGKNCLIYPGVRILKGTVINDNVIIHNNAVIGSDGFGFSPNAQGSFDKIPQIGHVIIESNVEIGANCCIDRGSMGPTIIRNGVKLDNLVQVAHNVEIGNNTVIAAQAGIAGSTKIGKNCMIGGQVGIVGHITIPDGTMIQAQSGVTKSLRKSGQKLYGSPAIEYNNYLKSFALFKNFKDFVQRLLSIEKKLDSLENQVNEKNQYK